MNPPRITLGRLGRGAVTALAVAGLIVVWISLNARGIYFRDALAYWRLNFSDLYAGQHVGEPSAYLYSPAFAQIMAPLGALPWPVFAAVWSGINICALVWMTGPRLAAVLLLFPGSPVADEVSTGNIHLLLGAAVVMSFRAPAVWSFPLLTKVTPGVGILWFAGRQQWRELVMAGTAAAVITVVSFALAPHLWVEWLDVLRRSSGVPVPSQIAIVPGSLLLRLCAAAVLALCAGLTDRRWLLPVPVFLALPVPWSSGLAVLVAMIPLARGEIVATTRRLRRRITKHEYHSRVL